MRCDVWGNQDVVTVTDPCAGPSRKVLGLLRLRDYVFFYCLGSTPVLDMYTHIRVYLCQYVCIYEDMCRMYMYIHAYKHVCIRHLHMCVYV